MARAVRFRKDSQTKFSKLFEKLCNTKSSWEVWADFIAMAATTISNVFDRDGPIHNDREQQYIRTIKRYTKEEQQVFPELFAVMVNALEDEPEQDFLGEMFMGLNLGNHWKGQFFTPYSICRMMSEISIDGVEARIEERGWVGIHDPCCGAGALLIAARNVMVRKKQGPRSTLFVAQDIDRTAALMCYLQLSLLGCAGYVVVADSIFHPLSGPSSSPLLLTPSPDQELWLMPAMYDEVWAGRIQTEKMRLLLESLGVMRTGPKAKAPQQKPERPPHKPEQTAPKSEQPPPGVETEAQAQAPPLNEATGGQLTLF